MLSYFGGEGDEGVITRLMIVKKCEYWCVIWCVCVCLCVEMCVCVAMCLGKLVSFVSFCVCVNGCVIFCVFVFACVSLRLCVMCPGCSPWSERKSGVSVLFQRRKRLMSIHYVCGREAGVLFHLTPFTSTLRHTQYRWVCL